MCSGIEAASVAWEPLGWKPLAFSEIEPFPRAVLAHHYPDTPLHGDFTTLKDMPFIVDADLLCGGTPCQAFSVAGNRQSLSDDRGNLSLQFVLLADAIDHLRSTAGKQPAWILWENVPGVLSTSDNAFGHFLGGLCGRDAAIAEPEGGWSGAGVVDGPTRTCAWRILDAQHFGVAQRRKRVFVLAKGGAGKWAAADALLPIIQGSQWHPAPRRSKGEGIAAAVEGSIDGGCGIDQEHNPFGPDGPTGPLLKGSPTGGGQPMPAIVYREVSDAVTSKWAKGSGGPSGSETGNMVPVLCRMREGKEGGGKGPLVSEDQSLTLATANDQVLAFRHSASVADSNPVLDGITPTLRRGDDAGQSVMHNMQVRRLTPVECERLQGFPIVRKFTYISLCIDPLKNCVDVVLLCHRLHSSVWPVGANELMQNAPTAVLPSVTHQAAPVQLAAVRALTHYGVETQEIHSHGRLIWSAKNADGLNEYHPPTHLDSIVQGVVRQLPELEKEILGGRAGSQPNTSGSSPQRSGEKFARLSIGANTENANAAEADQSEGKAKFTISVLGRLIPKEGSMLEIALCSVLRAISTCIPDQTLPENFYIAVELGTGYTNIPWKGKPESPDGPRYKALGNSWAVPCARYIGEQIQRVIGAPALGIGRDAESGSEAQRRTEPLQSPTL